MARALALAAAIAVSLLAVSGAGGMATQQTPKRGGTVFVAYSGEPACLNPLVNACVFAPGTQVLRGAFQVGPDLVYRPDLVSSVDTVSKKPFTLTYHIRPEARWSDGAMLTARDFFFSYQAFVDPKLDVFRYAGDYKGIRRIDVLDTKTLRVVLRDRDPEWRRLFSLILPRHALAGEDLKAIWQDTVDNPKTGRPIGSGPFLVERLERGKHLTLVRNSNYWRPHRAYLDRLVYRFLPPADVPEELRRGDVDLATAGTTTETALLGFRRHPVAGVRLLSVAGQAWEHFEIRIGTEGHPALQERLVRQALAYGIDRQAIAQAVLGTLYGEKGATVRPLDSVVFLANSPSYQPNWKGYRNRPAHARSLLEQARCRLGADGIYVCAGERLSLRFITTAGSERRRLILALVQAQLRRVGVEVRAVFVPIGILLGCATGCIFPDGDFDVVLFSWATGPSLLGALDFFRCQGGGNYTGYCDRLVTRDLVQSARILDFEQRVRLVNRIDARLARAVPWIPLFQTPFLVALRAGVRGVVLNPYNATWNSEDWWLER